MTSTSPTLDENSYFIDAESGAEMARLLHQDRLFTKGMGGLFAEQSDLSKIHRILDLACGPGGWVLDVAYTYPDKEVVGIDISHQMIEYAEAQARVQALHNANFRVMDILKLFEFSENSFDLVNARLIGFIPTPAWIPLMQECRRITQPGGIIRLTETELSISTSAALEHMQDIFARALKAAGQSFSPDGHRLAMSPMLEHFLGSIGCIHIQKRAHVINYSFGTDAHEAMYQNSIVAYKLMQPFLIDVKVTTPEEVEQVYQQMMTEMLSEDFHAEHLLFTAWGTVSK